MSSIQRPTISIMGFFSGLVTGLALAVAIALYVTNSPVPFVNKVQHTTENITPEAGDPNRPLFSPQIPGPVGTPEAGAAAGPVTAPAPAAMPPAEAKAPSGPRPASEPLIPPAPPPVVAAPPTAAAAPPAGGVDTGNAGARLMLQVGAYRSPDDADAVRAHLALLGLDAKVSVAQSDGAPLYRVRLGPFGQLDDLNGIRRTLSENGMEPQIVHVP